MSKIRILDLVGLAIFYAGTQMLVLGMGLIKNESIQDELMEVFKKHMKDAGLI